MASETGITSMPKKPDMYFSGKSRKHLGFVSRECRAVLLLNEVFDFAGSLTKLLQNCSKQLRVTDSHH